MTAVTRDDVLTETRPGSTRTPGEEPGRRGRSAVVLDLDDVEDRDYLRSVADPLPDAVVCLSRPGVDLPVWLDDLARQLAPRCCVVVLRGSRVGGPLTVVSVVERALAALGSGAVKTFVEVVENDPRTVV